MASKLVVALACFALCHSSPVLLNGYIYRDGRSFSMGQAYGGNRATGSASINGDVVQAYGSASSDDQFARNGYEIYPGQLVAQAEAYDNPNTPYENAKAVAEAYDNPNTPYGNVKAVAEAQNTPTYYAVPAPATIVSYEQNFEVPSQGSYEVQLPGAITAESNAVVNGNSESSVSSVRSDGAGTAQSSAQTNGLGTSGVTSTKANIYGSGFGSASSNANNAYGSTVTSANTQGYGVASSKSQGHMGLTSAESQSNGGSGSASSTVNNALESAVATANTQGFGSASSNANINNVDGSVVTSAKTNNHQGKGWRFGLLYGTPPHIRAGSAQANTVSGAGGAKSTAQINGGNYGIAQSTANAQGSGILNAKADINGGYVHSIANSQNLGYGATKYTANTLGYDSANSIADIGYGTIKSTANSQGAGHANANADVNGAGAVRTTANTNGNGSASSTVNSGPTFGTFKSYVPYVGTRSAVNAQTSGVGSATSSVQGMQTGYRVLNSSANSSGYGTAQANAQSF